LAVKAYYKFEARDPAGRLESLDGAEFLAGDSRAEADAGTAAAVE
jgi:hypothetical protein